MTVGLDHDLVVQHDHAAARHKRALSRFRAAEETWRRLHGNPPVVVDDHGRERKVRGDELVLERARAGREREAAALELGEARAELNEIQVAVANVELDRLRPKAEAAVAKVKQADADALDAIGRLVAALWRLGEARRAEELVSREVLGVALDGVHDEGARATIKADRKYTLPVRLDDDGRPGERVDRADCKVDVADARLWRSLALAAELGAERASRQERDNLIVKAALRHYKRSQH